MAYKNLISKQAGIVGSYRKLMKDLAEEFQISGIMSYMDLHNRKKLATESVGKFYASITSIAGKLYPDMATIDKDQVILGVFINGLPPKHKEKLLNNQTISSSEEAFKLAQMYERTDEKLRDNSHTPTINHILGRQQSEARITCQALECIKQRIRNLERKEKEREDREARNATGERRTLQTTHTRVNCSTIVAIGCTIDAEMSTDLRGKHLKVTGVKQDLPIHKSREKTTTHMRNRKMPGGQMRDILTNYAMNTHIHGAKVIHRMRAVITDHTRLTLRVIFLEGQMLPTQGHNNKKDYQKTTSTQLNQPPPVNTKDPIKE